MSLPNELLEFLLIYLSSYDMIESFYEKEWIKTSSSLFEPLITNIKFNHSQLQILFPTKSTILNQYPYLKSIIWNYRFASNPNNHLSESYLNIFKTKCKSLILNLDTDDINDDDMTLNHNIALLLLLQNDSIIEKLILKDISDLSILWFSFKANLLKMNEYLKELTIKLHYIHDLFILIEYLPKLEYLNVEVCELDKNNKYDYKNKKNKLSSSLKYLIIDSLDFSYNRLLLFIEPFQKSLQYLTLNMSIDEQINGKILESTIHSQISNLKEFKFIFQISIYKQNIDINNGLDKLISTFHSTSYWSTHPVMCYHDRSIPCFTIVSLPWILKETDTITDEILCYRTNLTIPLQINNIKSIYLASTPITLKFLKFIKETFPKLNKMIISWHTCSLDSEIFQRRNRIILNTIKTLQYYGSTDDLEYIDFLLLTPNIRYLVVDGNTIHVINSYIHENQQIALICEQISDLNIFREYEKCDEDETKETFPNALISSKEI
ncbi:unnamed protein product [Adineta steineri]|uniref:F-box domain-containing protein n=1 Tax=Adineta steineri TaxID=433720 RepID=A0A814ZZT9_9BILA|nr:unnamed protein product [Adineta steineri]CAF3756642.1 unnamed protein product [Adineta steineri]